MSPDNELDQFIKTRFKHLLPSECEGGIRVLYHYTTLDTLRIITQRDADFLCTYCATMNDKAEFATGLKVIEQFIRRHPEYVDGLTADAIKDVAMNPQYAPWSMSFSTNGDSLNQWIAYTDEHDGGVAVGFDINQLYERLSDIKNMSSIMFLSPCLYEVSHKNEIEELLSFLFGPYKKCLCAKGCEKSPSMSRDKMSQYISFLLALIFSSVIKDESFRLEHEWRLVVHPLDTEKVRDCVFIGGKPRIPTGVFGHDFMLANSIKRIVCSPHGGAIDKVEIIAKLRQLRVVPVPSVSTYTTI